MTSHRNATSTIIVIALVLLAVILRWLLDSPFNDQEFDRATWESGKPHERARMATDLIENRLDAGMKRLEVLELLGEPDQTRGDTDLYSIGSWRFSRGGHDDTFVHVVYSNGARIMLMEIAGL